MIRTIGKKPIKEVYRLIVLEAARGGDAPKFTDILKDMQHRGEITYNQTKYIVGEMAKAAPGAAGQ